MPAELNQIDTPSCALMVVKQQSQVVQTHAPRGMRTSRTLRCTRPARAVNGRPINPSFDNICNAYVAANFIEVGEEPDFLPRLKAAELAEFKAPYATDEERRALDGSLPPRRCAAILLLPGTVGDTESGRNALDAFALFATGRGCARSAAVTRALRCAALADADATLLLKEIRKAPGHIEHGTLGDAAKLAVRWLANDSVRSEVFDLHAATLHHALVSIQDALLRAQERFGAPVPDFASLSRRPEATDDPDANFHALQSETYDHFFALQEVERNTRDAQYDLVFPSDECYLRVIPRPRDTPDIFSELNSPHAAHGILLCDRKAAPEVRGMISGHESLPYPDPRMDHLGLHVVVTNVRQLRLLDAVTLFGAGGSPGAPLGKDGTSIGSFVTRAVPYAQIGWPEMVYPCLEKCIHPAHQKYVAPCRSVFQRTATMADRILRGDDAKAAAPAAAPAVSALDALDPAEIDPDDPNARSDAWLATALCTQLDSRRATLGDLRYHVGHSGAFAQFVQEAALRFGTATPLPAALEKMAALLRRDSERDAEESASVDLWKRVAAGAFAVGVKVAAPTPVPKKSRLQLQRVLDLLGLTAYKRWDADRDVLHGNLQALLVARSFAVPPEDVQELAASAAAAAKTWPDAFVRVAALYLPVVAPVFVLSEKKHVTAVLGVGEGGATDNLTFGEGIDLALATKLAFFQCHDGSIHVCRATTDEDRKRQALHAEKKALAAAEKRKREEDEAAETGETEMAEATGAAGQGARRRTVPLEMPRKPKNHMERWRTEAKRNRAE